MSRTNLQRDAGRFGVTVDFWHTLAIPRPEAIPQIEANRRAAWNRALARAGAARLVSARQFSRFERWCASEERHGRAPRIRRQADWMERLTGRRVRVVPLLRDLDRSVLSAPIGLAPGARPVLGRLRRAGFEIALLSNLIFESPQAIRRLLRRWEILPYFDAIVTSPEAPWSKPDPRFYLRALRRLKVPPARAIHLGDLPLDIEGARAARMAAARIDPHLELTARSPDPRVLRFRSWTEVSVESLRHAVLAPEAP
ncbi:MAG: HAD family hydrolase [Thermoplasmata archaeon]